METNGRPDALDKMPRAQAAQAWSERGNALADLKQFEEAVTSYRQALAIEPEFAEALFNLGFALQELERHEEALACYDQVLRVQPDHPKAFSNRGIALLALNRSQDSPWYPSARLFRQKQIGDWTSTVRAVAAELEAYCVRRPRFPWARFLGR